MNKFEGQKKTPMCNAWKDGRLCQLPKGHADGHRCADGDGIHWWSQ